MAEYPIGNFWLKLVGVGTEEGKQQRGPVHQVLAWELGNRDSIPSSDLLE